MIEKVRKIVTEKKDEIRRQYKAKVKGIFGSHVRGEAHPDSDVDLLVDFDEGVNLFDIIGLEQFLEDKLGCKVDMAGMRDSSMDTMTLTILLSGRLLRSSFPRSNLLLSKF